MNSKRIKFLLPAACVAWQFLSETRSLLAAVMESTPKTYCNPLGVPTPKGRSLADPTVFSHREKYYLYATGGQAWVSEDLVHWEYHEVSLPVRVVAPTVVEYKGNFYMSGNGGGMLHSAAPLGPWEQTGEILGLDGKVITWADPMFFVDDDGIFYCYHQSGSGVGTDGIYVTRLDPKANFTRVLGPSVKCFSFRSEHVWERFGDSNEFPELGWIEAAWMTKHAGRYYLQYSGCGTEWKNYAVGVYSSASPTGPFVYQESSPILKEQGALLNGTGHHAIITGPQGQLWMLYHVLFHNANKWDRRLALDAVGFDAEGRMFVNGPSELPQRLPGQHASPSQGNDAGLSLLSMNKEITASSAAPGRSPEYAVDNHIRTWWQAGQAGPQWLEVDLGRDFNVEASRIVFSLASAEKGQALFEYSLELSSDQKAYKTVLKRKAGEGVNSDIRYDELSPAMGRWVRLNFESRPENRPVGIIEFSIFGK
jgi:hypothetical protein